MAHQTPLLIIPRMDQAALRKEWLRLRKHEDAHGGPPLPRSNLGERSPDTEARMDKTVSVLKRMSCWATASQIGRRIGMSGRGAGTHLTAIHRERRCQRRRVKDRYGNDRFEYRAKEAEQQK
ncbi:hypothetical protein GTF97_07950 [Roseobacter sp. HKCCD8767]|uniref:hypothetical protein n=2 Tax=unclassified Roseobacter TaxID=196798 RepID=UPI0014919C59|nr:MULTISPECIES: hypothetical protein [unclassified Roseobacter]NNV38950.1 hypothetical protein [Roseobacter sp. HKCCD9054]NNV68745.1 hypothetical protein [Roseobacter sp. HKCCD8474]NNW11326.1 hypothetical protein [Roseobacter sp. HKCCD8484]NNW19848.1 hypothetical protein [Roseobacter sp. HKCCD7543]NNW45536.1 hypothetical protein [Roseobacter sp. HKCCD8291]NNW75261.1 hypothetical protein [Roseobacter sp. HKCCD8710]NNW79661.1 hypothetical protein [Roseobacter sp. HKCCD8134]NNW88180.1 hypothe